MKKVCLKTGLSYSIKGFSCVRGVAVDVEDGLAYRLLATGRFKETTVQECQAVGQAGAWISAESIAKMKKEELLGLAAAHNIDIGGCKNNEERIGKLQGALCVASFAQMGLED